VMATIDQLDQSPPPAPDAPGPARESTDPAGARSAGWLGFVLALLVSSLAFLLASSPARNSDLWAHLAAGRSLARGESLPAADSGLPPEVSLGRTWLYDLLAFGLYTAVGGAGLVLVKALLVAALALVLLRLSRTGPGWALPAACTALALLAIGA